ncbi:IDEAL domain-containing protein [Priestia endophytica]|uniref:IDEAL domain-containing protein n=1 Tax=Priestia endophytica TaxID=135735 RepID=UPI002E21AFEE|nr:IDEAL domain-containing protein [Priestia endophytica]
MADKVIAELVLNQTLFHFRKAQLLIKIDHYLLNHNKEELTEALKTFSQGVHKYLSNKPLHIAKAFTWSKNRFLV